MKPEYNVYCDESCHLEHDDSNVMVLGALWCLKSKRKEIFSRISEIKSKHGLSENFEIKWNKVSPAKSEFYLDLINYFFDDDHLHFRGLIIPDKTKLNHLAFNQTHDDFYYKMYFDLLKIILNPSFAYNIYIDIKDTQGNEKVQKLENILRNNHYDFKNLIVKKIQQVHSKEIQALQLADLITGSLSYVHRNLNSNVGKVKLIDKIKVRSGYSLLQSTLPKEDKFNIFIWKPRSNLYE